MKEKKQHILLTTKRRHRFWIYNIIQDILNQMSSGTFHSLVNLVSIAIERDSAQPQRNYRSRVFVFRISLAVLQQRLETNRAERDQLNRPFLTMILRANVRLKEIVNLNSRPCVKRRTGFCIPNSLQTNKPAKMFNRISNVS